MFVPSLASIEDFTTLVPHLIYLRTKLSHISLTLATNTLFLRLPSTLRELSLSTWSIDYADGHTWENLLSRKFPSLKHFRLIISLDQIPEDHSVATTEDLDGSVQSFNQSKYFLDHRWTVLLSVNDNGPLKFVLHTLPYPIENFQSTLLKIRRSTAAPPMIKAAYRDVSRLTLSLQDDPCPLSLQQNEHRHFPRLDQLTFLSNLTDDIPQFQSAEYLSYLRHMTDLSTISKLKLSEEVHQYPITFVRCLMEQLPGVISLTVSNRLFVRLGSQAMYSLKSLTLIFTIYSPSSTALTRMHHLLQFHQKLTNDLILELVRRVPTHFPFLQSLSLVVRDLDVFDQQLPEWLRSNFSSSSTVKYDLISNDGTILFHF